MLVLILVAGLVAGATVAIRGRPGRGDLPERIVTAAANRIATDRPQWAAAVVAELAAIVRPGHRWAFAPCPRPTTSPPRSR